MWKFMTDRGEIPYAFVNGYNFGDRLLEGVMFKITITKNNKFKAEALRKDMDYLKGLNLKKWLGSAEAFANSNDIFYTNEKENEEAWVVDEQGRIHPQLSKSKVPVPIEVPSTTFADLMKSVEKEVKAKKGCRVCGEYNCVCKNPSPKKLGDLSDADLLLYQSMLIAKMKEEILNIFSLLGQMPPEVQKKIVDEYHYYDIDDWKIMKEVLGRYFPELLSKGSRKTILDEIEKHLK